MGMKELGSLVLELILRFHSSKRETLAELDLRGRVSLKIDEAFGDIFNATVAEIEGWSGCVRVDTFVINLCRCEGISIAVSRDLSRTSHVVITHRLPPYNGQRLPHGLDAFVNCVDVHLILKLNPSVTVPTLNKVDQVEHDHERHRDVDVAVITGRRMRCLRYGHLVEVDDDAGDDG